MKFKFATVAAAMLAATSANAADLGKGAPAAVDYVKVCDAYGTGFFYIPGTETCLKLSGYVRTELRTGDSDLLGGTTYAGGLGENDGNRARDEFFSRARFLLDVDARTATEFGLLRSVGQLYWTQTGSTLSTDMDLAFIQWGGLTAGRATSFFDFWTGYTFGNIATFVSDQKVNLFAYTFSFGNGVTASVSLEDSASAGAGRLGSNYGGVHAYDIVGNVNVKQSWGAAQVMAAAHQNYGATAAAGDDWGWAVGAGVEINLPMLGAGNKVVFQAAAAEGALRFTGAGAAFRSNFDAAGVQTKSWSAGAGYKHNFSSKYEMNVQGTYVDLDGPTTSDYTALSLSTDFRWKPAAGLMIGVGLDYVDYNFATGATFTDGDAWVGTLRVQRSF